MVRLNYWKNMEKTQKFILNTDFTVEKFDNEILLYSVSRSEGVYLNETGYLVWEMCGRGHSVEEIITLLEQAYPQQKETIAADVRTAIESLTGNGALLGVDG